MELNKFSRQKSMVMCRKFLWIILLFFFIVPSFGQEGDILKKLLKTVQMASEYDAVKLQHIDSLRNNLKQIKPQDLQARFRLNQELLQEFKVFNQDSAFVYGLKSRNLAIQMDSLPLIAGAVLDLAGISVSAGMYKETLDFLKTIEPKEIPENLRSLYYGLLGRVYSEMAEYSNLAYFSSEYNELASNYRNLALELTEKDTFFHSFLKAFTEYKQGMIQTALQGFKTLLGEDLNPREKALVHYLLGNIHEQLGKENEAIEHFARASILDIKTSTKETLAIIRLSELLFEREDLKIASLLIGKANEDAAFYGAQHRKLQVGAILPLIEEKVITKIEEQRERLYRQNVVVSLLLLFAISLAIIIYLQVRRLKRARKIILKSQKNLQKVNRQITAINKEIQFKNIELEKVNYQLLEANKIKEEYIGFFFTHDADIFEKFQEFKNKIEKDLKDNDLNKAKYTLSTIDLKREKEKLLKNFDEAFINLFPNFIAEFNFLLKEGEQIKLKEDHILNKELRIFALLRLGITHNEIIAQILGYSINSIYSYKTKIRNKSWLNTKEFDQRLIENTTLRL